MSFNDKEAKEAILTIVDRVGFWLVYIVAAINSPDTAMATAMEVMAGGDEPEL